ncbi:MAG: cytidine deaminase [Actinomycetota bacterium]|nr:cytidine deaminase [Actinomycetota bacterium]
MTDVSELHEKARNAAANSYAPYSDFHVGAAVVATDGRVFTGCNVENAAYGAAICAEANAISTAAAAGVRRIDTVVVACLDAGECYPCGNCRQLMREFSVKTVVVQDGSGSLRPHKFDEILPHSFGPDTLEK